MIDIQKLKALAEAVRDLEDSEHEDELTEAMDALWLHMHCHTILDLIAEIERVKHEKRTGDQACRSERARQSIFIQIATDLIKDHPHERMGVDWDYEHPLHDLIIGVLTERDRLKTENEALRSQRLYWVTEPGNGLIRCVPDERYRKFAPSIRARYNPVITQETQP